MEEEMDVDTGTAQLPAVPESPTTQTDYYVLASDLSGGNPLANIPTWIWLVGGAALAYWYWNKNKNNERELIEDSEEE